MPNLPTYHYEILNHVSFHAPVSEMTIIKDSHYHKRLKITTNFGKIPGL